MNQVPSLFVWFSNNKNKNFKIPTSPQPVLDPEQGWQQMGAANE
jgi:hypothetical protein